MSAESNLADVTALIRTLRAVTVDDAGGDVPHNAAEQQIDALWTAISTGWNLDREQIPAEEVRQRVVALTGAFSAYCTAQAHLLRNLRFAAEGYLGGDFHAPDADLVHGSGFPGMGPPTLCGEGTKVPGPVVEITCPVCIAIHCDPGALAARVATVEQQRGHAGDPR